jgi:hypothetical protein
VDFDTGSSDLWVPGTDCSECDKAFPDWRRFQSDKSTTYQEVPADERDFHVQYADGESVKGFHGKDVLTLGSSIRIPDQVFAQITDVSRFQTCATEEGVFGLAFSFISSHKFPTPISNMQSLLRHPMFSFYLQATDDYPKAKTTSEPDEQGNFQRGRDPPTGALSELVFGGVDKKHYEGCLHWHDLGQFEDMSTGHTFVGYWDIKLQGVQVAGKALQDPLSPLALVDSGSTYIVGPTASIGEIAFLNKAECIILPPEQGMDPLLVECDNPFGFDVAAIECDQPILDLEFIMDGITYTLGKQDLLTVLPTSSGDVCILRLQGTSQIPVSSCSW